MLSPSFSLCYTGSVKREEQSINGALESTIVLIKNNFLRVQVNLHSTPKPFSAFRLVCALSFLNGDEVPSADTALEYSILADHGQMLEVGARLKVLSSQNQRRLFCLTFTLLDKQTGATLFSRRSDPIRTISKKSLAGLAKKPRTPHPARGVVEYCEPHFAQLVATQEKILRQLQTLQGAAPSPCKRRRTNDARDVSCTPTSEDCEDHFLAAFNAFGQTHLEREERLSQLLLKRPALSFSIQKACFPSYQPLSPETPFDQSTSMSSLEDLFG
eukprot:TRINITY_DN188_c0_g1_i1.p1 TRINITY_DN188_c0_g1~~TRINITY_DN188_c0_g1_i1.p1  ORF type:complete len:272 (-),score=30.71 TRINITY_DN188_c0_g1_i1:31-846(-)